MSAGLISELRAAIDRNNLVVICGAGVSLGATNNNERAGWAGLIRFGLAWCEDNGVELPGRNGLKRARSDVRDGDLISAADKLQRGLEDAAQWTRFLNVAFNTLGQDADFQVIDEILELDVPIATTNYDTLISGRGSLVPISWKSPSFNQALNSSGTGVAHLHGVWTEPSTVILGSESYGRLLATEQSQALERAMALRATVLMVGVGEGLHDPNFGALSRYLDSKFRDTNVLHVRLMRDRAPLSVVPGHIRTVKTGPSMAQQAEWIRALNPRRATPRFNRKRDNRSNGTEEGSSRNLLLAPLLRGLGPASPTLSEFWPTMIIDMKVKLRRRFPARILKVSEWLAEGFPDRNRVCVIGPPGGGKSLLLRSVAIHAEERGHPFVFYESSRLARNQWHICNGAQLFVDGLDELAESEHRKVVEGLEHTDSSRIWVSCRKDLFERVSVLSEHFARCDEIVEILPLEGGDVDQFLTSFGERSPASAAAAEVVRAWRKAEPAFADLLAVPLNLTLSVFLAGDTESSWEAPGSRHALYHQFYEYYVSHEASRLGARASDKDWIADTHAQLATSLYVRRQDSRRMTDLVELTLPAKISRRQSVLSSLLICDAPAKGRRGVKAFVHDTFMEWLVARRIFSAFEVGTDDQSRLAVAANDDVNSFIRDMIASLPEAERRAIAKVLTQKYYDTDDTRAKEHIVYYVGRLQLASCPDLLVEVYKNAPDPLLRRSAALGAILHGHRMIAEDYMDRLSSSFEEEEMNRAVQLVYFGDTTGDVHTARDAGGPWGRTRSALLRRLATDDERSRRLRWWDLYTLNSFCVSRGERLSEEEAEAVKNSFRDVDLAVSSSAQKQLRTIIGALCSRISAAEDSCR